ncbi:MAG: hypothetical protein J6J04_06315 [Oscillospiraceae bacterium]|nr:hypothetical protein [Oscillospiraceae bacterium]
MMAEFCLDCFNKISKTNYTERDFILSDELDLCEECGEWKQVIIVQRRGRFAAFLRDTIYRFLRG